MVVPEVRKTKKRLACGKPRLEKITKLTDKISSSGKTEMLA